MKEIKGYLSRGKKKKKGKKKELKDREDSYMGYKAIVTYKK